ncbi:MAG: DUF2892 domain-containing protein [bacterium]|nr:DUF2892 domain-containing protein [bacterium]
MYAIYNVCNVEIDSIGDMVYNGFMNDKVCNRNPVVKYIRIALSLAVIGLGIYYQNPVGVLGLFTLYTAFTGNCGASFRFTRKTDYKIKE